MDPKDVIANPQTAVELAKIAAPIVTGTAESVNSLFKQLFGSATCEIGEWLGDRLRIHRQSNVAAVFAKAVPKAEALGIKLTPPDPKLFVPMIDGMSLESDATLQEMWASLLVSASAGDTVPIAFVNILKEMHPNSAKALSTLYNNSSWQGISPDSLEGDWREATLPYELLVRHNLAERVNDHPDDPYEVLAYRITILGFTLFERCER